MSNLGTSGRNAAAAAVMGAGAYTARFGLAPGLTGVTGEPTNGVGGYSRPTITVSVTDNQIVVTSAITLGAFTSSLGPARAISLHDASGNCRVSGWLSEQRQMANGTTLSIPANSITITVT